MYRITTPYGDTYTTDDDGNVIESRNGKHTGDGKWRILGLVPVGSSRCFPIPLSEAVHMDGLLYKNGNPRFTVVDFDHGSYRQWGNTKHHGVKSVTRV